MPKLNKKIIKNTEAKLNIKNNMNLENDLRGSTFNCKNCWIIQAKYIAAHNISKSSNFL